MTTSWHAPAICFGIFAIICGLAPTSCPENSSAPPGLASVVPVPDAAQPSVRWDDDVNYGWADLKTMPMPDGGTLWQSQLVVSLNPWRTLMNVSADGKITFEDGKQYPACEPAVRVMMESLDRCQKDHREYVEQINRMLNP